MDRMREEFFDSSSSQLATKLMAWASGSGLWKTGAWVLRIAGRHFRSSLVTDFQCCEAGPGVGRQTGGYHAQKIDGSFRLTIYSSEHSDLT